MREGCSLRAVADYFGAKCNLRLQWRTPGRGHDGDEALSCLLELPHVAGAHPGSILHFQVAASLLLDLLLDCTCKLDGSSRQGYET